MGRKNIPSLVENLKEDIMNNHITSVKARVSGGCKMEKYLVEIYKKKPS